MIWLAQAQNGSTPNKLFKPSSTILCAEGLYMRYSAPIYSAPGSPVHRCGQLRIQLHPRRLYTRASRNWYYLVFCSLTRRSRRLDGFEVLLLGILLPGGVLLAPHRQRLHAFVQALLGAVLLRFQIPLPTRPRWQLITLSSTKLHHRARPIIRKESCSENWQCRNKWQVGIPGIVCVT